MVSSITITYDVTRHTFCFLWKTIIIIIIIIIIISL